MKKILLITLMSTSIHTNLVFGEEGFFSFDLPKTIESAHSKVNLDKIKDATLLIQTTSGFQCPLNIINKDGLAITALHCLTHEFEALGSIQVESQTYPGNTLVQVVHFSPQKQDLISVAIGKDEFSLKQEEVQIILSGKRLNYLGDFHDGNVLLPTSDSVTLATNEDYVFIKLSSGPYNCRPMNTSNDTLYAGSVLGVGFPARSSRSNGLNSDGESLYFSKGTLSFDFKSASWISDVIGTSEPETLYMVEQAMNSYAIGNWGFLSDMDSMTGMSGGGVYDSEGLLLGILSNGIVDDEYNYHPFSILGIRADWIVHEFTSRLGKEAENMIKCQ